MLGWSTILTTSTSAAAGRTTRFGTTRRSMSVAVTTTSAATKIAAASAASVRPEDDHARGQEDGRDGLDRRMAPADGGRAAAAAAAERDPGEERQVVVPVDLLAAVLTGRARVDERVSERKPRGDDVQETAERKGGRKEGGGEDGVHDPGIGLRPPVLECSGAGGFASLRSLGRRDGTRREERRLRSTHRAVGVRDRHRHFLPWRSRR